MKLKSSYLLFFYLEVVEIDVIGLIADSLVSLSLPVIYGWYDENLNTTHISYLEFDNTEDEFADDEATTEEHWLQVDIWTKDITEAQSLKKQVKALLKANGLLYQDGGDQFEVDTEIWHMATRWLYTEDLEG